MKKLDVIEITKYIINNKATVGETANHFNCSESSIKKNVNEKLPLIDETLYQEVKIVQAEIEKKGHALGGKVGKRTRSYDQNEIEKIARVIIDKELTIEDAAKLYNIPKSSLYDNVTHISDKELLNELKKTMILNYQNKNRNKKDQIKEDEKNRISTHSLL